MPIVRNSFIQMSKLTNLKGRINYISSHARQENLYAVYETTDRKFWTELAKCNQEEFKKSGTEGKCIEARELIIALPESFVDYEPDKLLKLFTEHFKQNYDVECIAALHHNKRKTNYHVHLIFSERKLLDDPVEKIATRNMFYDETGKHVRTKKEILDEAGQLRSGSIQKSGRNPALFKSLIMTAIYALELLISKVFKMALEKADKVTEGFAKSEPEQTKVRAVNEPVMAKSEPIPEMPKKSKLASKYLRLADIYNKLEKQNEAIYQREQQLASVEKEIAGTKGIFKGKQRKELQEQAEQLQSQIASMKQYLSNIVQGYGYKNVKEFLAEYRASKAEYNDYQSAVARWKQQTGNKAESDSLKAKLQRKQQEVKERENNRQSHYYRKDRGGR